MLVYALECFPATQARGSYSINICEYIYIYIPPPKVFVPLRVVQAYRVSGLQLYQNLFVLNSSYSRLTLDGAT